MDHGFWCERNFGRSFNGGFTARGHVEMDWVNDNMVDVIDRLRSDCGAFRSNCFLEKRGKTRANDDNVNARKVNDA